MSVEARLWLALREVEDPEIPISVVGMGLIVSLAWNAGVVDVQLTFTAMGCPAMDFIQDDIRERLLQEPDEELAVVSARAVYDEQPWIHMIIVPRAAIREAIAP